MTTAREHTAYTLTQQTRDNAGFETWWENKNTLKPHTGSETVKHWITKALICRRISELNDVFWTEVPGTRGTPDVLRLKLADEKALIYEIETGYSSEDEKAKAAQYTDNFTCGVIQDCYVIDPLEAPDSVLDAAGWIEDTVL